MDISQSRRVRHPYHSTRPMMFETRNNTSLLALIHFNRDLFIALQCLPCALSDHLSPLLCISLALALSSPDSPTMSETGCGRLISVLAFYIFSCSCLHGSQTRKPSREARNESQFLWREEIESGPIPSFVRNGNSRHSSGGSSRLNTRSQREIPSFPKATSQFSLSVTLDAGPRPLESLLLPAEKQKSRRITTVTISELPKINPSIDERNPPIVSAAPDTRTAIAWMTLPPPPARVMRAINRAAHIHKASRRDGINMSPSDLPFGSSATVTTEEIEPQALGSWWEKQYPTDSTTIHTKALSKTPERPCGAPLYSTFGTQSNIEYECCPITAATKTHTLPHDKAILSRTPSLPAANLVEMILNRPVLKGTPSLSLGLDGFEDIYG